MSAKSENNDYQNKIPTILETTGFVFEHDVAQEFRNAGWNVIVGRYYVDDVDNKARELDLIAYKITKSNDFEVVTSILISCKKDAENCWVVMSRPKPTQDPNVNWRPVHYWTNNKLLDVYLRSFDWSEIYESSNKSLETNVFKISRQAFAFQLISKKSQKVNNDRPVFQSMTDLLKALNHEMSILPKRMKKPRVYNFNLLTVVDLNLFEVGYEKSSPVANEINEFRHLVQYIVSNNECVARVNICTKKVLIDIIKSYDEMAKFNNIFFDNKLTDSYKAIKYSPEVQAYFSSKITIYIAHYIKLWLSKQRNINYSEVEEIKISIDYPKKNSILNLNININYEEVIKLNANTKLMETTKVALVKHANYSGEFIYCEDFWF